ncbi:hypothetical protein LOTGIDRAFT_154166 [Lottia gigantea]|uniref:UPAR/Ly6 domain-containing protein qvr n=1 Tax=Lottia gigantea TaxID=225164 RepID=V3ZXH2_LOTGI|nr:hypothetical protein LOTGIDRAFT_154166 [Lottia gigantea]ESO89087.1 hypothetical protein LOTGIDRAFT_154166 [Lottia gigantea]
MASQAMIFCVFMFFMYISPGDSIQCFQCDSNEDISCPNDEPFDTSVNAKVDCNSFEAHTPGQFCVKIVQESPGWRGWKKVTRRCGSRTDFGVAWGCRWSWDYTGVFRETCYCETSDGCNGVDRISTGFLLSFICFLFTHLYCKLL